MNYTLKQDIQKYIITLILDTSVYWRPYLQCIYKQTHLRNIFVCKGISCEHRFIKSSLLKIQVYLTRCFLLQNPNMVYAGMCSNQTAILSTHFDKFIAFCNILPQRNLNKKIFYGWQFSRFSHIFCMEFIKIQLTFPLFSWSVL